MPGRSERVRRGSPARRSHDLVECWGSGEDGAAVPPDVPFADIALAHAEPLSCGIRLSDGHVQCWGALEGVTVPGAVAFESLSGGDGYVCGIHLDDGEAECWGPNAPIAPAGIAFEVLSSANGTCGIRAGDQRIECFGAGAAWDLGPAAEQTFVALSIARESGTDTDDAWGCGVRMTDGEIQCWGDRNVGGGVGPESGDVFLDVQVWAETVCAQRAEDQAWQCWPDEPWVPFVERSDARRSRVQCFVREGFGDVRCRGNNGVGQATAPTGVAHSAVAAGVGYACALPAADGLPYCWGSVPGTHPSGKPMPYAGLSQISAGLEHVCGLRVDDGTAVCWGSNVGQEYLIREDVDYCYGEWSNEANQAIPPEGVQFSAISAAGYFTCGIRASDAEVQCWGEDGRVVENGYCDESISASGQTRPPDGVQFASIDTGFYHACGVRLGDGEVECWGDDEDGRSSPPTGVPMLAVSAGDDHTCAIATADGAVTCWGSNASGQSEAAAGSFLAISAGSSHTCGIRSADGIIACWGQVDQSLIPVDGPYESISAGKDFTCAVRQGDGANVCWGKFARGYRR